MALFLSPYYKREHMQWINLVNVEGLAHLVKQSFNRPQLIFKYSSACSLSEMMKMRLEKDGGSNTIDFHFLDILRHRPISNKIAEDFHVHHESPQVLLIINGECVRRKPYGYPHG